MRVEEDFEVAKLTSFKVGGKIKKVYFPECETDFIEITDSKVEI